MRPISKGLVPVDENGAQIVFTKYARSRRYLIDRIGEFCSYCERKIEANLAVEHVQPKATNPALALEWDNFLLGCTNCNSTKGDKSVVLTDFVWPDMDNTFEYFEYNDTGIVHVSPLIQDPQLRQRIQNMLDLVGLQKHPPQVGTVAWQEASDRRFEHRLGAWKDANIYKEMYENATNDIREGMKPLLVELISHQGFWSIWMSVFKDFQEIQLAFAQAIVGTNISYFPHLQPDSDDYILP